VPADLSGDGSDGRSNYVDGSANLEARASIWDYAHVPEGQEAAPIDWFCDLVEWEGTELAADIGAGSGRFLPSLARRAGRVIGLDLSPAMLNELVARESLPLLTGDVCQLPLRDGSLDRALAAWMLYHAGDPALACAELRRVLRPQGVLIVVTNAAAHCSEFDELYHDATEQLLGEGRPRPRLVTNRFTLDHAAQYLSRHFASVIIHARRVCLRLPRPEPVVAYLGSVRTYIDMALFSDGVTFDDLVPHIVEAAEHRIAITGAVEVTGLPAAIVCR
jgi:SAM-dependent methyltransferase